MRSYIGMSGDMTERTIRHLAREYAGMFYEQAAGDLFGSAPADRERSRRFRATFPTLRDYMRGIEHLPDGSTRRGTPGWLYFVDMARARLAQMLGDPNVKEHLKPAIMAALLEEHRRSTGPQAVSLLQRRTRNGPAFA